MLQNKRGAKMTDELKDIRERFSNLSDDELLKIVHVDYADYREEALEIAKDELNKRNILDIKEDKKDELTNKPDDIPVRWLQFYTYFRLPVGLIISIVSFLAINDATEQIVSLILTIPFVILAVLVFIGLHKRRLWGWKLNWALIGTEIILFGLDRAEDGISFGIFFSIALLVWFTPNYIYFNKRRLLFS